MGVEKWCGLYDCDAGVAACKVDEARLEVVEEPAGGVGKLDGQRVQQSGDLKVDDPAIKDASPY